MSRPAPVELPWQKSSFCNVSGCVEAALISGTQVAVRDSKNPDQGFHLFDAAEWTAFLKGVRAGEFDYFE